MLVVAAAADIYGNMISVVVGGVGVDKVVNNPDNILYVEEAVGVVVVFAGKMGIDFLGDRADSRNFFRHNEAFAVLTVVVVAVVAGNVCSHKQVSNYDAGLHF